MAPSKPPPYFIQLLNALDGADLSANARNVLMAQFKFGTHANGRDSKVGEARLVAYLQTSPATLRRGRKELREKGWLIERKRGHNGRDEDVPSHYDIAIPPPTAPAPKTSRAPRNREGFNKYKRKPEVTGDTRIEVKQTSIPSKSEVTGDHLSGLPKHGSEEPMHNEDEEQRHSSIAVETGRPDGESGSAFADRDVGASGDEPLASGPHVAGTDRGSAPVSKANQKPDPWGPPLPQPHHNYEPRHDLPPGAA